MSMMSRGRTLIIIFSHIFLSFHAPCSNAIAGETSLDRLANALGGKCVLPHIISSIPEMLQSGMCMEVCVPTHPCMMVVW